MIVTLEYLNDENELIRYSKNVPEDTVAELIETMDADEL